MKISPSKRLLIWHNGNKFSHDLKIKDVKLEITGLKLKSIETGYLNGMRNGTKQLSHYVGLTAGLKSNVLSCFLKDPCFGISQRDWGSGSSRDEETNGTQLRTVIGI